MPGTKALWTGSISFGLVSIAVELRAAVAEKEGHFHLLHDKDGGRVRQRLFCEKDGKEVARDHVVKGYEVEKGKYVQVAAAELKQFAPEATQRIDISDFVALADIDPIYYAHTYVVVPTKQGAKAYVLLREAMQKSERVGIAKVVIRSKQSLCALRPSGQALLLATMHYADEIIAERPTAEGKPSAKELVMAQQLIGMLTAPFQAANYKDDYREKVLALLQKKAKGKLAVSAAAATEKEAEVIDLVQALQRSLQKPDKKRRKSA